MADILDGGSISDPEKIKALLMELKARAKGLGPYTKEDYQKAYKEFTAHVSAVHTLHNAFGCDFVLTRNMLHDKKIYFRFVMSRMNPNVLRHLSRPQFRGTPIYRGVILRTEFKNWCEFLFGSKVVESGDFLVTTIYRDLKPKIGEIILELENNNARHKWESIIPEEIQQCLSI